MVGAPRREALRVTTGPLAPSLGDQGVNHVIVVGHVPPSEATCRRARPATCGYHVAERLAWSPSASFAATDDDDDEDDDPAEFGAGTQLLAGNVTPRVACARKGLQSSAVVQSCSRRARSFRSGSAATDAARRRSPDDPRSSPGRARLPTSPAHAPPGQQSSPAPSANAADTSEPADASDAHPKASAAGSASSILKLTFHTLHSPCPRLAPRATAASARSDAPTTTAAACSPPLAAAAHR